MKFTIKDRAKQVVANEPIILFDGHPYKAIFVDYDKDSAIALIDWVSFTGERIPDAIRISVGTTTSREESYYGIY